MILIQLQIDLAYDIVDPQGADFVFNIHAAHTPAQTVSRETLAINQDIPTQLWTDPRTGTRLLRLHAGPGQLSLAYKATVALAHYKADPVYLPEVPVRALPLPVMEYLYPSRYCQSDRLAAFAMREFGSLPRGYGRVQAIQRWVQSHVSFRSNTSNASTSAIDTLVEGTGVCRDFAHLMIALCRAVNIPARMATGTDYGADPALGPPDLHAYVECYLGDRWFIFDASGTAIPMGLVRFGTGRDAADVAFATIFGTVNSWAPWIRTEALHGMAGTSVLPHHSHEALSTSA